MGPPKYGYDYITNPTIWECTFESLTKKEKVNV